MGELTTPVDKKMKTNWVDMELDTVANMEVDKVADKVADMEADMFKTNRIKPEMF